MFGLLVIFDGFGYRLEKEGNAILTAGMPFYHDFITRVPFATLEASGKAVGLSDGVVGNSEAGHLHIGTGSVVWQPLAGINNAILDSSFYGNEVLCKMIDDVLEKGCNLHLMGLFSDGGIHAHIDHLIAVLRLCKDSGIEKVFIHAFGDGRDVGLKTFLDYSQKLEKIALEIGIVAPIVSVCGRYFAMDRDRNMDRTHRCFELLRREGSFDTYSCVEDGLRTIYPDVESDYYLPPFAIGDEGAVVDGDSVLFFNYRTDRARQLTEVFMKQAPEVSFTCMSRYEKGWDLPVVFEQAEVTDTLGSALSLSGFTQYRIAETEKGAHVTFFMNALRDEPYEKEERIIFDSAKVASFREKPEMEAESITGAIEDLASKYLRNKLGENVCLIINYANGDMVGHSGNFEAAVSACRVLDDTLKRLVSIVDAVNTEKEAVMLLTADHGNVDTMIDENGAPWAGHSGSPVPFAAYGSGVTGDSFDNNVSQELFDNATTLCDIRPILLHLIRAS